MVYFLITGAISVVFILILAFKILEKSSGNERTTQLSEIIQKGAKSFLLQEYKVFFPVIFALAIFLYFIVGIKASIALLIGSAFSVLAGYFGMAIATRANARTAWAATKSLGEALSVSFSGGAVMGLTVSTLGILGLALTYYVTKDIELISYYSLGASFVALFARVGGGIYTKAADVGADIVGKTEANLPEDDPRNPAVIADNVGDNVGDVAGMGADLYESYVGSIFSAIVLGSLFFGEKGFISVVFVVIFGLLSSLVGIVTTLLRAKKSADPAKTLRFGTIFAGVLTLTATFVYSYLVNWLNIFYVVFFGVFVGLLIGLITEWYTSGKKVENLAKTSTMGPANVIISGTALGMESTFIITLLIALAVVLSYKILGLFGVALSGVGMLSTLGISLSVDAYGPIADNAGGIAQMAGLDPKVREITDSLDAVGNTTAAMGKGFAIGSAALTALALFANFSAISNVSSVDLSNPYLFLGALIGGMLPFFFSALTMHAVGDAADDMVEEIRRQIKEIPGILSGESTPDYQKCIQIATKGALKKMVLPAVLAILSPTLLYFLFGPIGVGGLLIGATVSGVMLAIFMANSGGAWDNAKKFVEEGHFGGKGSFAHKATVVGDTVGDPYKDTSGPSINILIKLMAITSIVLMTIVRG
ncbi:membrane-bound proton-translocating pyrophosphatase [Thermosipho africanus H17ap60334]|uniref:Putative K(+)-stimulated pyrophosphate-energized sodium pump n=1 Tax=Thermosipho africanus (strain TCF52B) TaxID=484019 RepID=B7IF38_THEAB|nr:sodium-translocating pyrophosphatase [Thermosipho africanus]ACJ74702.1 pyrophosphate-energized proton pump [Thermosipho africanus TCF52B]EKF48845.1 membrane-bound proton-translocating pyrophosphatase [Thermosipho africanus H17ap60334]HCF39002.1 sodium-translocating pyrophosphatase [Thermosipho africanus]